MVLVGPSPFPRLSTPWGAPAPAGTLERREGSVTWTGRPAPGIGGILPAGTHLNTGADGRAAFRLATGISVRVDVETSLRILSPDELGLEEGGAYIDTGGAKGPAAGVTIRTPLGVARDVGTRFQVRATTGEVRISVREGSARFERGGTAHEIPAGSHLLVGRDGAVTRGAVSPAAGEWEWTQSVAPEYPLEGSRLGEYLDWIGKESGLRIEYGEPFIAEEASTVVLHGTIGGLPPADTLALVLPTCGLTHRIAGDSVRIERATAERRP